jgi:hypothetical protein
VGALSLLTGDKLTTSENGPNSISAIGGTGSPMEVAYKSGVPREGRSLLRLGGDRDQMQETSLVLGEILPKLLEDILCQRLSQLLHEIVGIIGVSRVLSRENDAVSLPKR